MKHHSFLVLVAAFGLLAAPTPSPAQSVFSSGSVQRIYPDSAGAIYFRLKSDNCNTGTAYYVIEAGRPALKNWYAMLLSSAETNAVVSVALPNGTVCGTADNKPINYLFREY